jgi:alanyl-tRNA synthetase
LYYRQQKIVKSGGIKLEKLYYNDQYIREFTAEIVDIKETDSKFHVVLDKTAFFPGGGGQFADSGKIDIHEVVDIYEENGLVYHVLEKKPIKIHKVKCYIDWEKREDGMHQHFGQHILSASFVKLFNANTVGFHLGNEVSTIDIIGQFDEGKIREVEKYANEIISENITTEFLVPTRKELKKMGLKIDVSKIDEEIRVVKINDLDVNPCCGVHPRSTLDVRMIKIKKYEKYKQGMRIEFLAGNRAINYSIEKDSILTQICRYLSCSDKDAIRGISSLNDKLQSVLAQNKKIEEELMKYQVKEMIDTSQRIGDISIVKSIYNDKNVKEVGKVASKIVEHDNVIALMVAKGDDKVNFIFACSKNIKNISMNDLLKDALTLVDGRGGGSPFLAQGGGNDNGNIDSAIDYAFMKINNTINNK